MMVAFDSAGSVQRNVSLGDVATSTVKAVKSTVKAVKTFGHWIIASPASKAEATPTQKCVN